MEQQEPFQSSSGTIPAENDFYGDSPAPWENNLLAEEAIPFAGEKAKEKRDDQFFGTLTMQLILCVTLAITVLVLRLAAPSVYQKGIKAYADQATEKADFRADFQYYKEKADHFLNGFKKKDDAVDKTSSSDRFQSSGSSGSDTAASSDGSVSDAAEGESTSSEGAPSQADISPPQEEDGQNVTV